MSPNLISCLLHIGAILALVKDSVHSVEDVVAGKVSLADAKQLGMDVLALLKCGLIPIPGLSEAQVLDVVGELESAIA